MYVCSPLCRIPVLTTLDLARLEEEVKLSAAVPADHMVYVAHRTGAPGAAPITLDDVAATVGSLGELLSTQSGPCPCG